MINVIGEYEVSYMSCIDQCISVLNRMDCVITASKWNWCYFLLLNISKDEKIGSVTTLLTLITLGEGNGSFQHIFSEYFGFNPKSVNVEYT